MIKYILILTFEVISLTQSLIHQIDSIARQNPEEAMIQIDEAVNAGKLQIWRADSLRARIMLEGSFNIDKSVECAINTLQYDSIRLVPERHLNMLAFISRNSLTLGHHSQSIHYALKGAKLADEVNNRNLSSLFDVIIGTNLYFMRDKKRGGHYLQKAVEKLKGTNKVNELKTLSYAYGQIMSCFWSDHTPTAIEAGKQREKVIKQLSKLCPPSDSIYIDNQKGFTYSKMADFYALQKNMQVAQEYKQRYYMTHFSKSTRGKQAILDYYNTIGDPDKLISRWNESHDYWLHKDTICGRYCEVLLMLANAYGIKGDYEKAIDYRKRQNVIRDSILVRDNEDEAIRMTILYQIQEKELDLEKEHAKAERINIILLAMCALLLVCLAFLLYLNHQHQVMKYKNKLLVKQMEKNTLLLPAPPSIENPTTETVIEKNATSNKCNRPTPEQLQLFHHLMDEEKVYLQTDFSRMKLQSMMSLSKNALTPVLQEVLEDNTSLSDYITERRITWACKLLKENPDKKIDAVAEESGFYTFRNFRRCFKERLGMSPSEYRTACKQP